MSRRSLLMLILVCGVSTALRAAPPVNDYYDPTKSTDGQSWPPFYKEHKLSPKHAYMYEMGWCRWKPYEYKPEDLIDVNKLPQVTVEAQVSEVHKGLLAIVDSESHETKYVAVHESPTISRVRVEGTALPEGLVKGMYVKFVGIVGADQKVKEPVDSLEIFTPTAEVNLPTLTLNKRMVVWGQILSVKDNKLVLAGVPGKSKPVNLTLAKEAKINVRSGDYTLAKPGDKLSVKGRLYHPEDQPELDNIFALEIKVTLSAPVGEKPATAVAAK